jgi:hypothetical protein
MMSNYLEVKVFLMESLRVVSKLHAMESMGCASLSPLLDSFHSCREKTQCLRSSHTAESPRCRETLHGSRVWFFP